MGSLVITNCLVVAFKIFKYGGSVVVKIWIGVLLKSLSLGISLQSICQFTNAIIVNKKVC